ncbi:MAG: hypothetical protein PHR20_06810 [Bacteroidales bacterium]|nr:hypothetical protein [Bacteroidales bacterium]
MKKIVLLLSILIMVCSIDANAQLGNLGGKIKSTVNAANTSSNSKTSSTSKVSGASNTSSASQSAATITNGNSWYVCLATGSARGEGTKDSPVKDIQKAIDKASNGDVICIAEGNYLGNLDRGWIEIKGKYVSLEGGWNDSFTERNPLKYVTRIQPGIAQRGTIGMGVLMIEATADRDQSIIIDGIFFDEGLLHEYAKADPTDERYGCPEGCETGRIMPVGNPPNKTIRIIGGKVAGTLIIRNCMFLNASFYGIIMTNMGGEWEIYNNVFVSNLYASCEINGGLNQATGAHQSKVDFHHNTVLFSWTTTKEMESMGYGYRFRNGCDHDVHNNIFGCNNFGALDGAWDDSNLPADKRKICSAYDNKFFMNKGDIVIAGTSGGNWLYVPAKRFDEVEMLTKYEDNSELPSTSKLKDVIDQPYLKGFASLKVMTNESYDANSAANQYREAHGLNKQGTSTTRVSMYGNRYNFDKAMQLFGAEPNYGAQLDF